MGISQKSNRKKARLDVESKAKSIIYNTDLYLKLW